MLREICDVFKEAYRRGWITTRDGNASYRRPEQDWFYVTPSGVRKNELVPDMCIKLDIDSKGWSRDRWLAADDGMLKQQLNRGLKPTGELPMHWLLQRHLDGERHSRVVLHLHPTHVIAATRKIVHTLALAGEADENAKKGLKLLAEEYPEIFRYTRVGNIIGYIEPISIELGQAVANEMLVSSLGTALKCDVVSLDRHGAVSVGSDPWESFEHIERLNHICEIYLLSQT
jgi:L-fuculose-phosphate aldolase